VKRKRGMAEAMQRDAARMEEEEKERGQRGMGGEDMMAEGKRWQMQIQEDVSVAQREDEIFFHDLLSVLLILPPDYSMAQKINEEIMREREEEIKNIHKGMHQVNEIYKVRPMLFFFVTQYQSIIWT